MREIFYLTKRNCLVYLRDKSAVIFFLIVYADRIGTDGRFPWKDEQ